MRALALLLGDRKDVDVERARSPAEKDGGRTAREIDGAVLGSFRTEHTHKAADAFGVGYSQTLAKLERGHAQDLEDVRAFVERGLVDPERALAYLREIEDELFRYPAVDPVSFRRRVEEALLAR